MANTPDFRRTPVPPPPAPSEGGRPELELPADGSPLQRGQVSMTDNTRKQLAKLGWKPGDPVPGDLGQRLQAIQREIEEERASASPVPEGYKPPKRPPIVDIDDLPPEKQEELRAFLAAHKSEIAATQVQQSQTDEAEVALPEDAPPSVREAYRHAIAAQREAATVEPATELATEPEEPSGEEDYADSGGMPPLTNCPRCFWDLSAPFDVEITDEDKEAFVACMLGGTRFRKQYPLMGGQLLATFRSLSPAEMLVLRKQMRYDLQSHTILGDGEYFAELMEYRMVLSVEQLQSQSLPDKIIASSPELLTIPYDPPAEDEPDSTQLAPFKKWFYEEMVPQEPLQQILRQQHRHFQRLLEALETMAGDPDFWTGIEPRA